jgi:hypothetical protein
MATTSKLSMAYNGNHRSFGTCASNGWWRIHVRQRGWHNSTLDPWMVVDSRSSKRLAHLDSGSVDGGGFTFVGEVGTAQLWIRRRGWHSLDSASNTLFLLLTVTSSSVKVDSESIGEVGKARLSFQHVFPSAYGHKLFSGSRLKGSKCNPNFQGLTSSTLFLLLMVTSSSAEVGLKAQNATKISRAQLRARFSFCLWSQALQRK